MDTIKVGDVVWVRNGSHTTLITSVGRRFVREVAEETKEIKTEDNYIHQIKDIFTDELSALLDAEKRWGYGVDAAQRRYMEALNEMDKMKDRIDELKHEKQEQQRKKDKKDIKKRGYTDDDLPGVIK